LRTNRARLTPTDAAKLPLPGYWQRVLSLFEAYRQISHTTDPVDPEVVAALAAGHQWLLAARWPDRMPAPVTSGRPA
jgi:thymidylate synthase